MKTYEEINSRIKEGKAVVVTADEMTEIVAEKGLKTAAREVDVVTTATFGPMCSSGAFINFGHSDPPIKMAKAWLNDVPVFCGIAAVDAYIGATELSETEGLAYGGGNVIEDLVAGKPIRLRAIGYPTDCYPRRNWESTITKDSVNQLYLFNPRNAYQNYAVATNSGSRVLYTYMGVLLPNFGNATYSSAGQLSPLLNDPEYRTIGIGTRIFLGGTTGYVAWQGTQHNPSQNRGENRVPTGSAGTLAVIGDLKQMNTRFIRAANITKYGISLFVGIGIPIPILDEEMAYFTSIKDNDIYASVFDYGIPTRSHPKLGQVSYAQLRSGQIEINGKKIFTAPLSSYARAKEIADMLKDWLLKDKFEISAPVQRLPLNQSVNPLEQLPETHTEEDQK